MGQRIVRTGLSGLNGADYKTGNGAMTVSVAGCRGARRIVYGFRFPATFSIVGASTLIAQATDNVTRLSGSFYGDGVRVGMYITSSGGTGSVGTGNYVTAIAADGLSMTLANQPTAGTPLSLAFHVAPSAVTPNIALGETLAQATNEGGTFHDVVQKGWSGAVTPAAGSWITGAVVPDGGGFITEDVFRFRPTWTGYASPEIFVDKQFDTSRDANDPPTFVTQPA
jgi:hypothetical protein